MKSIAEQLEAMRRIAAYRRAVIMEMVEMVRRARLATIVTAVISVILCTLCVIGRGGVQ